MAQHTKDRGYDIEYRDQKHEMWLEGTSDEKPTNLMIQYFAIQKGFAICNVEIWYDNMQYFWRFNADIF